MHSASKSRFESLTSGANVSIGDNFKPERIEVYDTLRRLKENLVKKGAWLDRSKEARVRKIWMKLRAGQIPSETAEYLKRDHAEAFARFDAEEAARKN